MIKRLPTAVRNALIPLFIVISGFAHDGLCAERELRLTLDECFRRAMSDNLNLKAAALGIRYDGLSADRAKAAFDPALTFRLNRGSSLSPNYASYIPVDRIEQKTSSASFTLGKNLFTGGNWGLGAFNTLSQSNIELVKNYSGYLGFSYNQPFLKGAGRKVAYANIYIARLSGGVTVRTVENTAMNLLADVERGYRNLSSTREILDVKKMALAQAESLLAYNEKARSLGILIESDVLEAKSAYYSRKQELLDQENTIMLAEENLKLLLNCATGDEGAMRIVTIDPPAIGEVDLDVGAAIETAIRERPDYLNAVTAIEQNRILLGISRNTLLPGLDLNTSYRLNGSGTTFDKNLKRIGERDTYGWTIALNLSYPLGNRSARVDYERSEIDVKRSEMNLDNLKNRIATEIRSGIGKVATNRERIEVARLAVEANELKLHTEEEKFRNRLSTSYIVLQYQTDLANARNLYSRALMDYSLSVLDLKRAKGTLLKDLNISILSYPGFGSAESGNTGPAER